MKPIYTVTLLAVLLASLSTLQAAESPAPVANPERMPAFSWDRVPLYVHIRKDTAFTEEEIRYLATFPLITFEKATGHTDSGSVEAGTLKAARAVKAINPDDEDIVLPERDRALRRLRRQHVIERHSRGLSGRTRWQRQTHPQPNPSLRSHEQGAARLVDRRRRSCLFGSRHRRNLPGRCGQDSGASLPERSLLARRRKPPSWPDM